MGIQMKRLEEMNSAVNIRFFLKVDRVPKTRLFIKNGQHTTKKISRPLQSLFISLERFV